MDELELLKGVGDIWDDSAEIIESLHDLRKRILALCADAKDKDELAEVYKLVYAQVDLVLTSLRVTLDRIQSNVHAPAATGLAALSEKGDGAGDGTGLGSALPETETVASMHERLEVAAAEHEVCSQSTS
jgi:hypothetical protein